MIKPDKKTLLALKSMIESDPDMTGHQILRLIDKILAICELDEPEFTAVTESLIDLFKNKNDK